MPKSNYPFTTYKFNIETGFAGAEYTEEWHPRDDFKKEKWDAMSEKDREEYLDNIGQSFVSNYISWGYSPIKKSDDV